MGQCKGCGIEIQSEFANEPGYAKSADHELCQSCFRLKHYRDFKRVKANVNDGDTLSFIENFKGHIIWVLDIMHLSQSMHSGLMRALRNKSVILVVNKRDLLPKTVSNNKLTQSIMRAMKDEDVALMDLIYISSIKKQNLDLLTPYLEDAPCAIVGCVNAGKSSLLNALIGQDTLSVSPVASTTADVVEIHTDAFDVFDTPGLSVETALTEKFSDETLVMLSPQKTIKPQVFQLYEPQTILIGNLGAITIDPVKTVNVTSYLPFELKRIKPERLEANLKLDHPFQISNPHYKSRKWPTSTEGIDLEIYDLGFINFKGKIKTLETKIDESAELILRKAMI